MLQSIREITLLADLFKKKKKISNQFLPSSIVDEWFTNGERIKEEKLALGVKLGSFSERMVGAL